MVVGWVAGLVGWLAHSGVVLCGGGVLVWWVVLLCSLVLASSWVLVVWCGVLGGGGCVWSVCV